MHILPTIPKYNFGKLGLVDPDPTILDQLHHHFVSHVYACNMSKVVASQVSTHPHTSVHPDFVREFQALMGDYVVNATGHVLYCMSVEQTEYQIFISPYHYNMPLQCTSMP